jgi:hypothetical protein
MPLATVHRTDQGPTSIELLQSIACSPNLFSIAITAVVCYDLFPSAGSHSKPKAIRRQENCLRIDLTHQKESVCVRRSKGAANSSVACPSLPALCTKSRRRVGVPRAYRNFEEALMHRRPTPHLYVAALLAQSYCCTCRCEAHVEALRCLLPWSFLCQILNPHVQLLSAKKARLYTDICFSTFSGIVIVVSRGWGRYIRGSAIAALCKFREELQRDQLKFRSTPTAYICQGPFLFQGGKLHACTLLHTCSA